MRPSIVIPSNSIARLRKNINNPNWILKLPALKILSIKVLFDLFENESQYAKKNTKINKMPRIIKLPPAMRKSIDKSKIFILFLDFAQQK